MIAEMDQLLVVGRRSVAQEVLASLQNLGVVQVDPLEPAEGQKLAKLKLRDADQATKDGWNAAVARSESLLDVLGASGVAPSPKSETPQSLADVQAYLKGVDAQVEGLVAERGEVRDELDVINTYLGVFRGLAPSLAQLERSRYLTGVAFAVNADAFEETRQKLEEALDGRILLAARPSGKQLLATAAVLKGDRGELLSALSSLGLAELSLPERYAGLGFAKAVHTMEERSRALPNRLTVINNELTKLRAQHGAKLQAVRQTALNHQARFEALSDMVEGRYSFALQGWVPSGERARVAEALKKNFGEAVVVEARHADEHHDVGVPVKLENPGWVKPFEGLLSLFAPPKYGSFDPSWTLAVFFPLFFGLVVGDMGFGLIFLALGLWLRARGKRGKPLGLGPLGITISPAALPTVGIVIVWCAVWSIVFGFFYGEFFGNFLEKWYGLGGKPVFYTPLHHEEGYGWIPIILFRVEVFQPLLLLSLGFGVLQVLGGWGIRAYYGYKHSDKKHLWEGIGMFSGLLAVVIFSYAYLTGGLSAFVWVIVALLFALFIAGVVLSGVVLMIVELISNSGNILSYLRLFAVGLSAALVANLATNLGFALGDVAPVIGPILGILVALVVHTIAIALTIIGHTLQPLRLQYVEFFTKFGFYEENGRPYRPLRLFGGKA